MSDAFEREILKVLPREGRDSDDPDDAGGLTSRGITEATARVPFESSPRSQAKKQQVKIKPKTPVRTGVFRISGTQ